MTGGHVDVTVALLKLVADVEAKVGAELPGCVDTLRGGRTFRRRHVRLDEISQGVRCALSPCNVRTAELPSV